MKYIYRGCVILLIITLLTSCSSPKQNDVLYPDGMPTSSALSISLAETKLQQVSNGENIYFICDTIDFYQNRIYYIFQKCEDYADRVVTSAWYAVDVFTGEIYRYNDLGDKKLFEKIN